MPEWNLGRVEHSEMPPINESSTSFLLAPDRFEPLRREPEPVVLELKLNKKDVEKALKNFREETIKALDEAIDKCRRSMLE